MNPTLVRLAAQALFGQRRGILLYLVPVLLIGLSVLIGWLSSSESVFETVTVSFGFLVVLPLVALLAANGVVGPEIDDGSITYLLAKPISRYVVATSKYLVAAGATLVLGVGGLLVSGAVVGASADELLGLAVGGVAASLAYCGLFLTFGVGRRGMIAGLLYILIGERVLGSLLTGLRYLSVSDLGGSVGRKVHLVPGLPGGNVGTVYAAFALVVITVAGVTAAGWRLKNYQTRGED